METDRSSSSDNKGGAGPSSKLGKTGGSGGGRAEGAPDWATAKLRPSAATSAAAAAVDQTNVVLTGGSSFDGGGKKKGSLGPKEGSAVAEAPPWATGAFPYNP